MWWIEDWRCEPPHHLPLENCFKFRPCTVFIPLYMCENVLPINYSMITTATASSRASHSTISCFFCVMEDIIIIIAALVRSMVGLSDYSGEGENAVSHALHACML